MEPTDLALLLLRLAVGGTLIAHGVNHWRGGGKIPGTAQWFEDLGLRHGFLQAWASVVTEIGAGVLLVLGMVTPVACAAIVTVMVVAGLVAHRTNGFFVFQEGWEYVMVLAVAAVALGLTGPGAVSVDEIASITVAGWAGGSVALGVGLLATAILLAATWRRGGEAPR